MLQYLRGRDADAPESHVDRRHGGEPDVAVDARARIPDGGGSDHGGGGCGGHGCGSGDGYGGGGSSGHDGDTATAATSGITARTSAS